jgi:hypothetical protein
MTFELKNLNVLGTTINIDASTGEKKGIIIPPLSQASIEFDNFGREPMSWHFDVSTNSDAFIVGCRMETI